MLIPAGTKVKLTKKTVGYGNFYALSDLGVWNNNEEEIHAETHTECSYPDGFVSIIFADGKKYKLAAYRLNVLNTQSARPVKKGHQLTTMFQINSK